MSSASDTVSSSAPATDKRRFSGQQVILAGFAIAVAVAVVVILAGIFALGTAGDTSSCAEEPGVCDSVETFVQAFQSQDAQTVAAMMTPHGLEALLGVGSAGELAAQFERLPSTSIVGQEYEITRVELTAEDRATVIVRFGDDEDGQNAVYRLVRTPEGWRIDG